MHAIWLGTRPYGVVDALQRALFDARRAELVDDTVLFTEFEPVITLGRGAKPAHLLTAPSDASDTTSGCPAKCVRMAPEFRRLTLQTGRTL